jgi:hypothetical protein
VAAPAIAGAPPAALPAWFAAPPVLAPLCAVDAPLAPPPAKDEPGEWFPLLSSEEQALTASNASPTPNQRFDPCSCEVGGTPGGC